MSSLDTILNIDSTYTDINGNYILNSDVVTSVSNYNSTVTGTENAWDHKWNVASPFINSSFSLPTSGTWTYGTDDSATPYKHNFFRMPWIGETDLLSGKSVTSSGYSGSFDAPNLVVFNSANGWWTANKTEYVNAVIVDMGVVSSISHICVIPGFGTDYTNWVKNYRVGVSNTINYWDFEIVASGITTSGVLEPIQVFLGEDSTRYVKFYADTNWGGASYISVGKLHAYDNPTWGVFGYKEKDQVDGSYALMYQSVDLTEIDTVYIDLLSLMSSAIQDGTISFYVDSNQVGSTLSYSSTLAWVDSEDGNRWKYREYPVDVSAYSGIRQFKVQFNTTRSDNTRAYFYFSASNLATMPRWFYEGVSGVRGLTAEFPTQVYVVVDTEGLSVINAADNTLWMRFLIGYGYALGEAPVSVCASNGKVWAATSKGLYRIDFIDNRVYRYNSAGVYYRPSIAARNEYSKWFLLNTDVATPSDFIRCVACGTYLGDEFIIAGTSDGLYFLKDPFIGVSGAYNSVYKWNINSVSINNGKVAVSVDGGTSSRIIYYDSIAALLSENFVVGNEVFSNDSLPINFSLSGSLPEQLSSIRCGELEFLPNGAHFTVSGTKVLPGSVSLVSNRYPSRPFDLYADVRIDDWVSRCGGGLHLGAGTGWPYSLDSYYSGHRNSYSVSASNLTFMPVIQNDPLVDNIYDRWSKNISTNTTSMLLSVSGTRFYGYTSSSSTGSQYGPLVGSYLSLASPSSFTARVKVCINSMPTGITAGRFKSVLFGVSNGSGGSTSTVSTAMAFTYHTSDINPAAYNTIAQSAINTWTPNTINTVAAFSGDGTGAAVFHQWEFTYNSSTGLFSCSVDGTHIRTFTNSVGSNVYIVFGFKESDNSVQNVSSYFKDFEIDFGYPSDNISRKYILATHNSAGGIKPTVSGGTHLDGVQFDTIDGTALAEWRTWRLSYDGSNVSSYVDGALVGGPTGVSFGSFVNFFVGYDMPVTVSGISSVCFDIKNFKVEFDPDYTVISGGINEVRLNNGVYVEVEQDASFVSTTSGVNICVYTGSLAGQPDYIYDYGIDESGMDNNVLYGSAKIVSNVEPDSGVIGYTGLMYVGTSNYFNDSFGNSWNRWIDRPASANSSAKGCLCVSYLGDVGYFYYNYTPDTFSLFSRSLSSSYGQWSLIGCNTQAPGYTGVGSSRAYCVDIDDGNQYLIGPTFMSYFNKETGVWSSSNIGTGPVYVGGGEVFDDGEVSPAVSRKELFLVQDGEVGRFKSEWLNWEGASLCGTYSPVGAVDTCVVYSEYDNAIYVWSYGTTSNFYRIMLDQRSWEGPLSDPPVPYDVDTGIYGFYRPYDECLYFMISKYNRFLCYDIKKGAWINTSSGWFFASVSNNMSASYSPIADTVYLNYGIGTLSTAKYRFKNNEFKDYVSWEPALLINPEGQSGKSFSRVSLGSGKYAKSDSFSDSLVDGVWFDFESHAVSKTSVDEGGGVLSFIINNITETGGSQALRTNACPVPSASFSATMKVKILGLPSPNHASSFNSFVFGVTDYLGSRGNDSWTGVSRMGNTLLGKNGLWLIGYNTQTLSSRYSLWKKEGQSETRYGSTNYIGFNATDGTENASYRLWRIDYNYLTSTLSAYIDGVFVGSVLLTSQLKHGMYLCFGGYCNQISSSGQLDVDVIDLVVNDYTNISTVAGYMTLGCSSLCSENYYERYDCTMRSEVQFCFENDFVLDTYSTDSNNYVCTIANIENGEKKYELNALYDGSKKIGIYSFGSQSELGSYSSVVLHDWASRSLYKLSVDSDKNLSVFVDGTLKEELYTLGINIPDTLLKRVSFGKNNFNNPAIRNIMDTNTDHITTSGTWSLQQNSASYRGAYFGAQRYKYNGSSSDVIIFRFNCGSAIYGSLYMFYNVDPVYSTTTPIIIYHNGVETLPVSDSFSTNPLVSVLDNIGEGGASDLDATTVVVSQVRDCSGYSVDVVRASGWVYLGSYLGINRVIVTGYTGKSVVADTFKVEYGDEPSYSTFSSKVYKFGYAVGQDSVKYLSSASPGFSVVNLDTSELVDYYDSNSSPNIVGSDISDINIVI